MTPTETTQGGSIAVYFDNEGIVISVIDEDRPGRPSHYTLDPAEAAKMARHILDGIDNHAEYKRLGDPSLLA